MTNLLAYSFVAVLAAVSYAAPNPAVNRIDAPGHRPHSTITNPETTPSLSTAARITLKPREPAVNRIDAVGVNVHHKPTSSSTHSSSFRTLVSTTVGPHIALNLRDPAVNRIDAVGVKVKHTITTSAKITESAVSSSGSSIRPYFPLNPREPAVNRIDAVGDDVADQAALFSVAGGTPVTLAINNIQQLETAATDIISAAAVPMPVISVNPSPNNPAIPASFFAAPAPNNAGAIPVNVPNTQTTLYITLRPDRAIAKLDMGQVLVHAMAELRDTIQQNGEDGWVPTDDWSWFEAQWSCVLTADRNLIPAPGGRPQRLTYGVLNDALVGLWMEMYAQGRYFACDFEIRDARWGVVGGGRMDSWDGSVRTS